MDEFNVAFNINEWINDVMGQIIWMNGLHNI
jgi:hypothetical protein